MNIGIKIKEARLARNMTQEEFAKKIGVSKNAISNYENGVSTPKLELLCAIMKILDVDANYLYGVTESPAPVILSARERQVILAYRVHPEMQEAVDRLLQIEPEYVQQQKKA